LVARLKSDSSYKSKTDEKSIKGLLKYIERKINPTAKNRYTLWVIDTYVSGGINRIEDLSRTRRALDEFVRKRNQLNKKDIYQYKTLSDLEEAVLDKEEILSANELKRRAKKEIYSETDVLYKGEDGMIVSPKTEKASCFWGQGTKWCTSSTESENHFDEYNKDGKLYIVVKNNRKLQFHVESGQYNDENDREIKPNTPEADIISWALKKLDLEEKVVKYQPYDIR
jgi:hypothetical protein